MGNRLQDKVALITGGTSDIAEAALYLASDAGHFVNAHDLIVDGGRTSMFEERVLDA